MLLSQKATTSATSPPRPPEIFSIRCSETLLQPSLGIYTESFKHWQLVYWIWRLSNLIFNHFGAPQCGKQIFTYSIAVFFAHGVINFACSEPWFLYEGSFVLHNFPVWLTRLVNMDLCDFFLTWRSSTCIMQGTATLHTWVSKNICWNQIALKVRNLGL